MKIHYLHFERGLGVVFDCVSAFWSFVGGLGDKALGRRLGPFLHTRLQNWLVGNGGKRAVVQCFSIYPFEAVVTCI